MGLAGEFWNFILHPSVPSRSVISLVHLLGVSVCLFFRSALCFSISTSWWEAWLPSAGFAFLSGPFGLIWMGRCAQTPVPPPPICPQKVIPTRQRFGSVVSGSRAALLIRRDNGVTKNIPRLFSTWSGGAPTTSAILFDPIDQVIYPYPFNSATASLLPPTSDSPPFSFLAG